MNSVGSRCALCVRCRDICKKARSGKGGGGGGGGEGRAFGLELSRIKDIINGRTRDRHTYVRPECPAINTPVATKLDESEGERGAGV